jgi:hypothetical protein
MGGITLQAIQYNDLPAKSLIVKRKSGKAIYGYRKVVFSEAFRCLGCRELTDITAYFQSDIRFSAAIPEMKRTPICHKFWKDPPSFHLRSLAPSWRLKPRYLVVL